MFCTSKERETCDVEKMTCEGCYYNKDGDYMDEEEIKKGIELLKKSVDDNHKISEHCYFFDEHQMSRLRQETFKLADALNQEKEKNKKLEKEIIKLQMSQLPDTADEYKKLKKLLQES